MISTRRDSVRKKSSSAHRKSTVERPGRNHTGVVVEVAAASDPEVGRLVKFVLNCYVTLTKRTLTRLNLLRDELMFQNLA